MILVQIGPVRATSTCKNSATSSVNWLSVTDDNLDKQNSSIESLHKNRTIIIKQWPRTIHVINESSKQSSISKRQHFGAAIAQEFFYFICHNTCLTSKYIPSLPFIHLYDKFTCIKIEILTFVNYKLHNFYFNFKILQKHLYTTSLTCTAEACSDQFRRHHHHWLHSNY